MNWAERALRKIPATQLDTEEGTNVFKILSDPKKAREIERQHNKRDEVTDKRNDGRPHVGLLDITERNPATGFLRYRRAPDTLSPSDAELPESMWRARDDDRTEEERQQAAREALCRAFEVERLTIEETLPYRIRVAYRITRELARLKGMIAEDETLAHATQPDVGNRDPWTIPRPAISQRGSPGQNMIASKAFKMLVNAEKLDVSDQPTTFPLNEQEEPQVLGAGGLALLPPDIPWRWREQDHSVLAVYDEERDVMLKRWVGVVEEIARYLGIEAGSKEDPDQGRLGLIGLVNKVTTRALWPNRLQIVFWEEELIYQTLNKLITKGSEATRKWLADYHGFTRYETTSLVRMAVNLSRGQAEADVEELRALMVLRLEDYIRRAKDSCELRAELMGLKQLSIVQGLGKVDPEDAMTAFSAIVRKFDSLDQSKGILEAEYRQLPG